MPERPLGVILTGGRGTRLRPLTPTIPKALIPLLNRPLLAYSLDLYAAVGLSDVVVVVGGDHEGVERAAAELAPAGITVEIAVQAEPIGLGDAVASAGAALDGRQVAVLAVDAVLTGDIQPTFEAFERSGADAGLTLHPTDRPTEMGIAVLEDDRIVHLEEKPQQPRSDLAAAGLWLLGPATIERLRTDPFIRPTDGEIDLTGTIGAMVDGGADVRGWRLSGEWLDTGTIASLLSTQARLLELAKSPLLEVPGSALSEPLMIGAGTTIEDCELGPNVVVGDGAVLRSARLRDAMVVAGARLEGVEHEGVVVTAGGQVGRR
ncbi:MAG: sugar phosphate nucleotidyltransferase [Dehalococcoidia bacterium]|jgi:glucose-1-phosphate thymidylyltransferase|nr:sugar phosphate nucleotidyltransferase [Dehalococcoidia bacterium]